MANLGVGRDEAESILRLLGSRLEASFGALASGSDERAQP
jgi:hypothetical protein